jgi:cytochrome c biogenesis protein CcmG, thiol:disulfide interchange protein DsbE
VRALLAAVGLLALGGCAHGSAGGGQARAEKPVEPSEKGEGTPLELELRRYPGGETWQLSEERGSVVLLDVWATWCTPCKDTLPVYSELARQYGERGLKVYALSVDEDVNLIGPFLEQNHVTLPVLLDSNAAVAEGALGVRVMPTAYLIDRRGVVREVHEGTLGDTGSLLRQYRGQVEALLAEQP